MGWRRFFHRAKSDAECARELESYLQIETDENLARGMSAQEARTAARRKLGNTTRVREEIYRMNTIAVFDTLGRDFRYALRGMRRNPSFTVVAVLTLALGIGANAAIFSIVDAVFLHPLPSVKDPSSLAVIYTSDYSSTLYGTSSYPDYVDLRDRLQGFSGIAATGFSPPVDLDTTERLAATRVTSNYFDVLGLSPQEGRFFLPEDEQTGDSAVISAPLWRRYFEGDPGVIGRTIRLNDRPLEIVGVAPDGFSGARLSRSTDIWTPLVGNPSRRNRSYSLIGRLNPDISIAEAQAELSVMANDLGRTYPDSNLGTLQLPDEPRPMTAVPFVDAITGNQDGRGSMSTLARVLFGVVGLVLLIACANVASLLVARSRQQENDTAIRFAIGAGVGRIVSRFLVECVTLALVGGAVGLLLSFWLKNAVLSFGTFASLTNLDVQMNTRVLAFAFLVSVASGLLFAIAPCLKAFRHTESPPGAPETMTRFRRVSLSNGLVVVQVSVSLVLVVAAGLFVQTLKETQRIDTGFRLNRGVLVPINLRRVVDNEPSGQAMYEDLRQRVEAVVGPDSVAFSQILPLSGSGQRTSISVDGYTPVAGEDMELNFSTVDRNYFSVMGIDIVAGRSFDDSDTSAAPRVVIVNQGMASRYWPDRNPVGQRISRGGTEMEVVGVAQAGKYRGLREDALLFFYLPMMQNLSPAMTLVVKTSSDGISHVPTIRAIVSELDPRIPLFDIRTVEEHLAALFSRERATAWLFSSFGILATVLALLGTYGVMSFLVKQRTREIGIRMAVGASSRNVLLLVWRSGLTLAVTGVVIGVGLSMAFTRLLSDLLYGIGPMDVPTHVGLALALIFVLLLACYIPARRASAVDPIEILRAE